MRVKKFSCRYPGSNYLVRGVSWPVVDGKEISTCGYDEQALGLTPFIGGWGPKGYYLPYKAKSYEPTMKAIESVDWARFAKVKIEFEIGIGQFGTLMFTDKPVHFIDLRRYQRLVGKCRKEVAQSDFDAYYTKVLEYVKKRGRGKEIVTGKM